MSWEPVDRWPTDRASGGAFRAHAEPIIARRGGPTPLEWLRLFWHSAPEAPLREVAREVVLTPRYVYVARADGRRLRVARERVRGARRSAGRLWFAIDDGEDLVLPHRARCELSERLLAERGGPVRPLRVGWMDLGLALLFGLLALGCGIGLLSSYPWASVSARLAEGLYLAEVCLGFAGGWLLLAAGASILGWGPARVIVDGLGVEIRRGLPPGWPFFVEASEVNRVTVRQVVGTGQHRGRTVGVEVCIGFSELRRFASIKRSNSRRIAYFPMLHAGYAATLEEARPLGRAVADALGVRLISP